MCSWYFSLFFHIFHIFSLSRIRHRTLGPDATQKGCHLTKPSIFGSFAWQFQVSLTIWVRYYQFKKYWLQMLSFVLATGYEWLWISTKSIQISHQVTISWLEQPDRSFFAISARSLATSWPRALRISMTRNPSWRSLTCAPAALVSWFMVKKM